MGFYCNRLLIKIINKNKQDTLSTKPKPARTLKTSSSNLNNSNKLTEIKDNSNINI